MSTALLQHGSDSLERGGRWIGGGSYLLMWLIEIKGMVTPRQARCSGLLELAKSCNMD
jgi:hypothetical protein